MSIANVNALRVWEEPAGSEYLDLLSGGAVQDDFFTLAAGNNINRVYLDVGYYLGYDHGQGSLLEHTNIDLLREFLARANQVGIAVEFLYNNTDSGFLAIAQQIIAYNETVSSEERFSGIHYGTTGNIEHLLQDMFNVRNLLTESSLEGLTLALDVQQQYISESGVFLGEFTVIDELGQEQNHNLAEIVDYLNITNYAQSNGSLEEVSLPFVIEETAGELGVEITSLPNFAGQTANSTESLVNQLNDTLEVSGEENIEQQGEVLASTEAPPEGIEVAVVQELSTPQNIVIEEPISQISDISALWVWGVDREGPDARYVNLLSDQDLQDEFFAFLANQNVNTIYFEVGFYLGYNFRISSLLEHENSQQLRDFLARAHQEEVAVEFLDGDVMYWIQGGEVSSPTTIAQQIIEYNNAVPPEERFSGIHYDIEPHTLGSSWNDNTVTDPRVAGNDNFNDLYQANFLQILQNVRDALTESDTTGLTFAVDVPHYYRQQATDIFGDFVTTDESGNQQIRNFSEFVDYVGILNYLDTYEEFVGGYNGILGDGSLGGVESNLALFDLPLVFGAETESPVFAPGSISFYQEGSNALNDTLAQTIANFGSDINFAGIAVHSFASLLRLQPDAIENGTTGDDELLGDSDVNYIFGDDGNDTISTFAGNDILRGGAGNDYLRGGEGADVLDGGDNLDTVVYHDSDAGIDINITDNSIGSGGHAEGDYFQSIERVFGSNHNDKIVGNRQNNDLFGGAGNDQLEGGYGDDSLYGQSGHDYLEGGQGNDFLDGGEGDDSIYGGGGSDNIQGGAGNDQAYGNDSDDIISTGDGDDFLEGGDGADILDGGAGFDIAIYSYSGAGIILDLATGLAYLGHANGDRLSSIEGILGSEHDDNLYGDDQDNYIEGAGGDDLIRGRSGDDTLKGGEGSDTIYGDEGNDFIDGGVGNDTLGGGSGNDNIAGAGGNDSLFGGAGDDILDGGSGSDYLEGGAGADTLIGGDSLYDTAVYWNATSGVGVDLASGGFAGEAAGDTYQGVERVFGSSHDDTIRGDDSDNVINAGAGSDTLAGGLGQDIFVFGDLSALEDTDLIEDFEDGVDLLQIGGDIAFENLEITVGNGQTVITDARVPEGEAESSIILMGEFNLEESDFAF